ncbi:MAG: hypothetical protein R2733_13360 [Acidimicrobiales bacterium]
MTATDAPAPITDRPLGVIDLLDGAFHALRQRPLVLVLAVAWIAVPGALAQLLLDAFVLGTEPATITNGFGVQDGVMSDSVLVRLLLGWLVTALAGVPVARIVGGWLVGIDTTPLAAIRYTLRRLPVVGVTFVASHVATILGTLACLLPGFFFLAMSSLLSPVIAVEEAVSIKAALKRSWRLARANSGAVYGLIIAIFFTGLFLQGGLFLLVSLFTGLPERSFLVVNAAALLIGQLLILPLNGAAMSLLYLDARFRTEGFDLELRSLTSFPQG